MVLSSMLRFFFCSSRIASDRGFFIRLGTDTSASPSFQRETKVIASIKLITIKIASIIRIFFVEKI